MKLKKRTAIGLAVLGFLVSAGVVYAVENFDWDAYFDSNSSYVYKVEYDMSNTPGVNGPHTVITVTRGPILPNGDFTLFGRVVVASETVLTDAKLQVAHDLNHDGNIDESEWTTVANSTITHQTGHTTALTSTVTVNQSNDGWRIWISRTDIGNTSEMVTDHNLQVQGVDY